MGSLWISDFAYILFLSIAGGALIYVTMLMYNFGQKTDHERRPDDGEYSSAFARALSRIS